MKHVLSFFVVALLLVFAFALPPTVLHAADIPPPPDVSEVPDDAERRDSGLASRMLEPGHGEDRPGPRDVVVFLYTAWTTDGEVFDSSVARNQALRNSIDTLLAGLSEGLQLMVAGEKRRLWIPPQLAYEGKAGKPQGMLVFDVILRDVIHRPEAPVDVAGPPVSAEVGKGGLASKVLVPGSGIRHPKARDTVVVHYSGWTTDGAMFDSSILRGQPAEFRLDQVIRGWTLGLQLMVEGERRRLWIPEQMAYKGDKGKPQGMLVFDVELIEIK